MSEAKGMKAYWDRCATDGRVNWHIAHIDDEDEFFKSGANDLKRIFPDGVAALSEGARVLDIGCGKGRLALALAQLRPDVQVYGIDVSEQMIRLANNSSSRASNVSFVVGDGLSLEVFSNEMFDYVYTYVVLQHLPRHVAQRYVEEAGRILKPGGILTFQVQEAKEVQEVDPRWNDFRRIRYYTRNQASALVVPPMVVLSVRGGGHNLFVDARKVISDA